MDGLLPIIRRKRRPLVPGQPAIVPPRVRAPIDEPLASGELPREGTRKALHARTPLPARFDAAPTLTRNPAFWAVELQDRRRKRRAAGGNVGTFLVTQGDDRLITETSDFLTL